MLHDIVRTKIVEELHPGLPLLSDCCYNSSVKSLAWVLNNMVLSGPFFSDDWATGF